MIVRNGSTRECQNDEVVEFQYAKEAQSEYFYVDRGPPPYTLRTDSSQVKVIDG